MPQEINSLASRTGLGSGLPIGDMVDAAIDSRYKNKLDNIEKREKESNTRITGLGKLKSAASMFNETLAKLKDPDTFFTKTTTITNDPALLSTSTYFKAEAKSYVVDGNYAIRIEKLAKADKYVSTTAITTSTFSTGTINIVVGVGQEQPTTYPVTIDTTNNTLEGIVQAINRSTGSNGASASFITGPTGAYLVLTSKNTGVANKLNFSVSNDTGGPTGSLTSLFALANLPNKVQAEDAEVYIEGQRITSASNTIHNAIFGVKLDLVAEASNRTHTLTIARNSDSITTHVNEFMEAYNKLVDTMHDLGRAKGQEKNNNMEIKHKTKHKVKDKINAKEAKKMEHGKLYRDPLLQKMISAVRNNLANVVNTSDPSISSLTSIGVVLKRNGKLENNLVNGDDKLKKALDFDPSAVAAIFSDPTNGIVSALSKTIHEFLRPGEHNHDPLGIENVKSEVREKLKHTIMEKKDLLVKVDRDKANLAKKYYAAEQRINKLRQLGDGIANRIESSWVGPRTSR